MSERDYDAYRRLYRAVSSFLPPPDLIVYLRASVPTLLEHIVRRGNAYEQSIAPAYLQQLNDLYEAGSATGLPARSSASKWTASTSCKTPPTSTESFRQFEDRSSANPLVKFAQPEWTKVVTYAILIQTY